jgi:homoserine dehydrogenase
LEAISRGKHIVTANKALIATHGDKIFSYAHDQNVIVAFEAAVAGGIPIIKILREGLVGNKIKSIVGILNGTGNFILTKMQNEGVAFINALGDAQRLGYAEADPTVDIEGIDTAQKLSILSSIAFGMPLRYADVYIEGISHIKHIDLLCAKKMGYAIKHLAYAERNDINIELRVYPALIANTHELAKIDGVTNGVLINANAVGRTVYYGDGAGGLPTASAVIADLIDVIRTIAVHPTNRVPSLSFQPSALINYTVNSIEKAIFSYYLRFLIKDSANTITTNINIVAAKYGIKLFESKKMSDLIDTDNPSTVIITNKTTERLMNLFLLELQNNYNFTDDNIVKLRICDHGC